ncbi:MAG: DUF167 domain-containing protein [Gaiellaceae bacterium]
MSGPQTRLALRVSPGARSSAVIGRHGDRWKVRVSAPAESGRANEALLRLLAQALAVPRRQLRLVAGQTGRDKLVEVSGVDAEESGRRLASAQEGGGR